MIWVVLLKELKDSLRDRRSLIFALIYGPFLMPALMLAPTIFYSGKKADTHDFVQEVYVKGMDKAPNLVSYLRSKNIDAHEAKDTFEAKVQNGEYGVVIEVSDLYGQHLLDGRPAALNVYYLSENTKSRELFFSVSRILSQYGSEILAQRMFARGIDQDLLAPIQIEASDLSHRDPYLDVIARMLIFLAVFSMVMGAFYSAIDIVAGERERHTLEPLLSMPVHPMQLLGGKYLTILTFSAVCGVVSIINAFIWLRFLPDAFYGSSDVPGLVTLLKFLCLAMPVSVFLSGLLLLLSTVSKTVKEAQTQLGFVMLVVMSPFLILQFIEGELPAVLANLPVLGQYMHVESLMFESSYPLSNIAVLSLGSLIAGFIFFYMALQVFKKDNFLN